MPRLIDKYFGMIVSVKPTEKTKDDEFYRYLKGLDETDDESRRSPFEDMLNPDTHDHEHIDDEE